jgi:hypothetical protein
VFALLNRMAALRIPLTLIYVLGFSRSCLRSNEVLGCSFVFRRLLLCARMVAYPQALE